LPRNTSAIRSTPTGSNCRTSRGVNAECDSWLFIPSFADEVFYVLRNEPPEAFTVRSTELHPWQPWLSSATRMIPYPGGRNAPPFGDVMKLVEEKEFAIN
jgi:hypothetical protein